MDYTIFARDLLSRKPMLEASYEAMSEELSNLQSEMTAMPSPSDVPITGTGTNRAEARLINLIGRIDDTKFRMGIVERDLKMIEAGMKQMDEYERALLEGFFVHGAKNAAESMMNRFYKERSTIYNDRRKALEKFTRSVYGLVMV